MVKLRGRDGILGSAIRVLSSRKSCRRLFRTCHSRRTLPSNRILGRVVSLYQTVLFPNCCKGTQVDGRAVHFRANIGIKALRALLSGRVCTKLYFTSATYISYPRRGVLARTRGLSRTFVHALPRVHTLLTASTRTTFGNSPTTRGVGRIVFYCPNFQTIYGCHVTRRLCQLNIPFVPHVVARVTRSRANVSVRPKTRVKRCFSVSRKAKAIVNRADIVKGRIHVFRKIDLTKRGLPPSRGKGTVHNIPHRPILNSRIAICSGTALLKHVHVNRKTAVYNGI